jgi:hypothetical protein
MRKLVVFNQISLDGYFVDLHGDMTKMMRSGRHLSKRMPVVGASCCSAGLPMS